MNQLINTVELVKQLVGHEYLYFDSPVTVRPTEISYPFNAWAVCAGPDNKLYVMDSDEEWRPVEDNLLGRQLIGLLEEKVKAISAKMGRAIA
jgi:hypothetical protein